MLERDNMNRSIIDVLYVYQLPRLVSETLSCTNNKLLAKVSDISESGGRHFKNSSDMSGLLSCYSHMTS